MSLPCASTHASASCAGRAVFVFRDRLDTRDELQILVEVLTLEAWREAPEIVGREIVELANLAG